MLRAAIIRCLLVILALAPGSAGRAAEPGFPVAVGQSFRDCADCPEMVVIAAGEYRMGSLPGERGRSADESPRHRVRVARPLGVGKFPVTAGEYAVFARATQRAADLSAADRLPATGMTWDDARAYAAWLAQRTGQRYRLPTEAEWEYAARGGTTTPRWWGGGSQCRYANGADIRSHREAPDIVVYYAHCDDGYLGAAPVGSFPPNRFGLYDMAGNVEQWVLDCYAADYRGAPADAATPVDRPGCTLRVQRGGSFADSPRLLRAASRNRALGSNRFDSVGIRVVREAP